MNNYKLIGTSNPFELIKVDSKTGNIVIKNGLDREDWRITKNGFLLIEILIENLNYWHSVSKNIKIIDLNDNSPKFKQSLYEYNVDLNSLDIGSPIGRIVAIDLDSDYPNRHLEYKIDSDLIQIEPSLGLISLNSNKIQEINPVLATITAKDSGILSLNNSANLRINLIGGNKVLNNLVNS